MPNLYPNIVAPWISINKYKDSTVLVTQAHADDADWAAGGAVARLAAAGARVIYVVATKGEAGSSEPGMTKEKLAEIREQEQRDANQILGVSETLFLGHPDGRLNRVTDLDEQIIHLVREYKPELIFTFDVDRPEYFMHPDHRAIGLATLRAAQFSGLSLTYTDTEAEPFLCKEVLLYDPPAPNTFVPVQQFTYKKLQALAAHKSQMVHLLPGWLHKILYDIVDRGDRLDTRLMARALHYSFTVEPFRRIRQDALMR